MIPALLLLPLYLIGRAIWYRPPNVVHFRQVKRYLSQVWSIEPEDPVLLKPARIWLTLSIIQRCVTAPIRGSAWLLDELLYGRRMSKVQFKRRLFLISGGRSGSTQMSRYIEADSDVISPNLLQGMFPYLWLWRLLKVTVGRVVSTERVARKLATLVPPELLERHEFAPFSSDTFDGALVAGHLNALALYMGPECASNELNFARYAAQDAENHERDVVILIDRISRKHALFVGADNRIFFLKGHFLHGADAIERKWPDAAFLTMVRDPVKRIQSGINYLRVNPADPFMGAVTMGMACALSGGLGNRLLLQGAPMVFQAKS